MVEIAKSILNLFNIKWKIGSSISSRLCTHLSSIGSVLRRQWKSLNSFKVDGLSLMREMLHLVNTIDQADYNYVTDASTSLACKLMDKWMD
jgi:phage terminase Nu1 subunit (DNA packaging protein)